MFDRLSDKLTGAFQKLMGRGRVSEVDLKNTLREVRLALLEADVNYQVVNDFLATVEKRSLGVQITASLTPSQEVIKIVYEELRDLMGGSAQALTLDGRSPASLMLVGLQGSGKTTTAGKLACYLKKQGRRPFLVPADVNRPAAIIQLTRLAEEAGVPVFPSTIDMNPVDIAVNSLTAASAAGCDVAIIDTAGRLTINDELMEELSQIKNSTLAREILLVADAMTGQEAVNIAQAFNERIGLTGLILSKTEGDARGGAAMSIKAVVGQPLKFIGTGEKLDALDTFHPNRVASKILGMGDIEGLLDKARVAIDEKEARLLAKKMQKGEFTLSDFQKQIHQIKNMGSIESLIGMIPGLGKLKKLRDASPDEKELKKIEAIIDSMTCGERADPTIIDASRRKRIAHGSGTVVTDVNKLLKNFTEIRKMMQRFTKGDRLSLKNFIR
ncbi:MAG: signal recognition particle [Candidatus Adiutrix intracellularis]|jgi:signal recognition particle subunit SRP54|nr:MAG: signal recognition particle [Candidatus Adiutrix intracellularis]MDR2827780.1 signal recognition particle protein [Candidatus Adiutrix intracellularis]